MNLYKKFKTNKEKEIDGVWVEIPGFEDEDVKPAFKLARCGGSNKKFSLAIERGLTPHKKAIKFNALSPEIREEVTMKAFVKTVLLDWRDITNEDNEAIAFNTENAIQLFTDLPDLYVVLLEESSDSELFKEFVKGEDLKN